MPALLAAGAGDALVDDVVLGEQHAQRPVAYRAPRVRPSAPRGLGRTGRGRQRQRDGEVERAAARRARSRPESAPPISATSCAEIARPSPVPPNRRVVEPSACVNGSKIADLLVGRDADAGVDADVQRAREDAECPLVGRARWSCTTRHDDPRVGELERVADQVDQHLAQPAGSPTSRRARPRLDVHGRGAAPSLRARTTSGLSVSSSSVRSEKSHGDRTRACRPRSSRSRGCR